MIKSINALNTLNSSLSSDPTVDEQIELFQADKTIKIIDSNQSFLELNFTTITETFNS